MSLDCVKAIIQLVTSVGGIVAAFWALWVYHSNSRRERARWAEALYTRFYEKAELKAVRETLDCKPPDAAVADLVTKEPAELTDYLNFFRICGLSSIIETAVGGRRTSSVQLLPRVFEKARGDCRLRSEPGKWLRILERNSLPCLSPAKTDIGRSGTCFPTGLFCLASLPLRSRPRLGSSGVSEEGSCAASSLISASTRAPSSPEMVRGSRARFSNCRMIRRC